MAADFPGEDLASAYAGFATYEGGRIDSRPGYDDVFVAVQQLTSAVHYFRMRWSDPDCGGSTFRSWTVTGSPDTTGTQYTGTKCGATPITGAIIEADWFV